MKKTLKGFWVLLLLFSGYRGTAQASQEIYLSVSPSGKYRVVIDQVIDRRVGDKVFFRYLISLVNTRNLKHHFEMLQGGSPLVQETDKGTFQVHWPSIHFDWSKDNLKLFVQLETIEDSWRTYFVDLNGGKTSDITGELEQPMVAKFDSRKWDCEAPKMQLVKWVKPHLAFFKLTSICGKNRGSENDKLFHWSESVLFDTNLAKAVMGCDNSYSEDAATHKFEAYYLTTIPTPTPTPEETPTAQ